MENPLLGGDPFAPPTKAASSAASKRASQNPTAQKKYTDDLDDLMSGMRAVSASASPVAKPTSLSAAFTAPVAASANNDDVDLDAFLGGIQAPSSIPPATQSVAGAKAVASVSSSAPALSTSRSPAPPKRPAPSGKKQKRLHSSYDRRGDLCCDDTTKHHCLCFPCVLDGMYHSMNDPGFTGCNVRTQMVCLALPALWPLYWGCCCFQSYTIRTKFNVIIGVEEPSISMYCRALFCPFVQTAQVHREIELRGQPVWTPGVCSDVNRTGTTRVYSSDLYAPSIPDMNSGGKKPPYLLTTSAFGGGAVEPDVSLTETLRSDGKVIYPTVMENCCGAPVTYNSSRHCLLIAMYMACAPLCAIVETGCNMSSS